MKIVLDHPLTSSAITIALLVLLVFLLEPRDDLPEEQEPPREEPSTALARSDSSGPSLEELKTNPHALSPKAVKLDFAGPAFDRQKNGTVFKKDTIARAKDLHHPEQEPEDDLEILHALINSYRAVFLQNPIAGENREVVEALTGRNSYRLVFLSPTHPALNTQREIKDRWGTPYRFHPLSRSHMEISSAGPDLHFGTDDDVELEDPIEVGAVSNK